MSDDAGQNPYKDTIHLPQTEFPMRGNLVEREPLRLAQWEEQDIYHRVQDRRREAGAPKFILHDGPPFANGDVHMGTALNKIIKDLVLKSRSMAGFETPYVPGWDCHGLPIEFKVVREAAGLDAPEIRRRCEEFARKFIDIQRKSFRRLGVFGDWDHPYLTLSADYEAAIVRFFATAVDKGLVYRSQRPVQWSYGAKTALAEAEVEYKEKSSPAIFVKFPALTGPVKELGGSFVIWTTTPWTLPANLGIMVHADFTYVVGDFAHADGRQDRFVVARPLLESFSQKTGFVLDAASAREFSGKELAGSLAQHPFLDRESRVILAPFVTADTGTGQVHTAPGHGKEDYIAGREAGLGLLSPVDDDGKFTEECGLPDLVGMLVFDANVPIIKLLASRGMLVGKENYKHDYPHCWRSKTPIIFRAVPQFFLSIDDIRAAALAEIQNVQWLPPWGQARIYGTAENRPDWCISRQRTWGVPLPVFLKPDGEALVDASLARKVADLIEQHGTNLWFEKSDAEWCAMLGLPGDLVKCGDTLDVWIDSGCSSMAVTERHPDLGAGGIADLYIEATDQHRGWFQSSLMCSIIHRDRAPYKAVMTHGFVTDTNGEKLSKSGDKPVNAEHYVGKFGADIVRLWVSSVDWKDDVPFSDKLFQQNAEAYRRLRNTLRILLANLHDYDAPRDAVPDAAFTLVDRWILERLHGLIRECVEAYDRYDFRRVFAAVNQFCAVDLSALYVDITKDRLYCDATDSPRRRATQTAMARILDSLTRLLAPILAFTAEEAWESAGHKDSVHLETFPVPDPAFAGNEATLIVEELLNARTAVQVEIEKLRQAKIIGSNLEARVVLLAPEGSVATPALADPAVLEEFLIVSDLEVKITPGGWAATATASERPRCARCWRHEESVGRNPAHPDLCQRCDDAVTA